MVCGKFVISASQVSLIHSSFDPEKHLLQCQQASRYLVAGRCILHIEKADASFGIEEANVDLLEGVISRSVRRVTPGSLTKRKDCVSKRRLRDLSATIPSAVFWEKDEGS